MTTDVLLIRHASHDRLGRVLCGRSPGVTLSQDGRAEAGVLARSLRRQGPIDALYASPLERAQETAAPIAEMFGLRLETDADLDEVDFGRWTGKTFDDLGSDPAWQAWNRNRDQVHPPGGETMIEAQVRAVRCLERVGRAHEGATVALVSHADMIKTAVAWGLGLPLGFYARFEIAPASISRIRIGEDGVSIRSLNQTSDP